MRTNSGGSYNSKGLRIARRPFSLSLTLKIFKEKTPKTITSQRYDAYIFAFALALFF